jgi:hypothetical protein
MSAEVIGLKTDTIPSVISDFTATAARALKTIIRKAAGSKWRLLLTIAVGALLAVVAMKLMALLGAAFDISFLRNSGSETGNGAGFGAGGAGLGGGAAGGAGGGDGGGGGGGTGGRPWWEKYIPSRWTTITVGPVSIDTKTGHVSYGPVDVSVTPGSDPSVPVVNITIPPTFVPPPGDGLGIPPLHIPSGTVSVGINQQNVPLTGSGSTNPTGSQILNAPESSDGTFNNIGH